MQPFNRTILSSLAILSLFNGISADQFKKRETVRELYAKKYTNRSEMQQFFDSLTIPFLPWLIMHELGHACAAKLLNGDPINIHLGAKPEEVPDEMLNYGKTNISLHSFNCNAGFSVSSDKNLVPIYMAGPLVGMATSLYMFKKVYRYMNPSYSDPVYVLGLIATVCAANAFISDALNVTPFNESETSDGQQIWKNLGLSEESLLEAREGSPMIHLLASCVGTFYLLKRYSYLVH